MPQQGLLCVFLLLRADASHLGNTYRASRFMKCRRDVQRAASTTLATKCTASTHSAVDALRPWLAEQLSPFVLRLELLLDVRRQETERAHDGPTISLHEVPQVERRNAKGP